MAVIRRATPEDIEALLPMCSKFISYTEYRDVIGTVDEEIGAALRQLLEMGAIFVAEIEGIVKGFIACMICPAWFSPSVRVALEMAWWMEEDARKGTAAIRLVQAYEKWAKESGASFICMSDLVVADGAPLENMLGRMGYRMTERTHMKGLDQC